MKISIWVLAIFGLTVFDEPSFTLFEGWINLLEEWMGFRKDDSPYKKGEFKNSEWRANHHFDTLILIIIFLKAFIFAFFCNGNFPGEKTLNTHHKRLIFTIHSNFMDFNEGSSITVKPTLFPTFSPFLAYFGQCLTIFDTFYLGLLHKHIRYGKYKIRVRFSNRILISP